VDETNYNPIAALFGGDEAARTNPAPAPTTTVEPRLLPPTTDPLPPSQTLKVDPDRGLNTDVIKNHEFKLPSELDLSNVKEVKRLADEVAEYNHTLGWEKQQAKRKGDAKTEAKVDADIKALAVYSERLHLLAEGHHQLAQLKSGKGLQLKMCGDRFGDLAIDPTALAVGQMKAFKDGHLVFEAPSDETLHDLLTKRFTKMKHYTPHAVKTFTGLVKLAGLPVHGRKSNKHKLICGAGPSPQQVLYYNDPNALIERLKLLIASQHAGNTGVPC